MPKKTTTTIVEEENLEPVTNEEYAKLHDADLGEVITEAHTEETTETPVETTTEEVVEEAKTPEIDAEKLKQEIAEQTTETVKKEIEEYLKEKTPEQAQETKEDLNKWEKDFFEKEGRQPTWTEALEYVKDTAKAEIKAEQAAEATRVQEEQQTAQRDLETRQEATNKFVDQQLDDLYTAEKLPRIVDKENPNDPGIVNRKALFTLYATEVVAASDFNKANPNNQKPLPTLKEVFFEKFKPVNTQPAGADAPVGAGEGAGISTVPEEISYEEMHNSDWGSWIKSAFTGNKQN